ncbi:MAG: hypothetical protein ASARMPREDX12_001617 [Alectoria sarmentosa]|nr:MAG: hypothetical protein ASARMPREDX12_001617 [Alectoria sarmentosa]
MDSLADLWVQSGKKHQRLYQGSIENIVKELKAWVERRKANNNVIMELHWNTFHVIDSLQEAPNQPGGFQDGQIAAIMTRQLENLDRNRDLEKEKNRETLLANFFLATLKHRGTRWPRMPHIAQTQADADVCAFLGTVDQGFDARTELEILEDSTRITQWRAELRRRDAIRAQEIANNPIPGVNTHPIGAVGGRFRQEIANDPTKSTMQAFTDAADSIMIPGSMEFIMGRNSAGTASTPSTTGQTNHATADDNPTTDDMVVYMADTLGNINIATGPSSNIRAETSDDLNNGASSSSSNATVTPEITNVAPGVSSNAPADTLDITNIAAGPSSSTATDTGTGDRALPVAEGQDEGGKVSKAKKKREGRKRAKAARAQGAAEKAGTPVGDDDDDDEDDGGEIP